jgi:hypothetical protein
MKVLLCGGLGRMPDGVTAGPRPVAPVREGRRLWPANGGHAHCPAAVLTAPRRP